ncbi:hypothetical protein FRACYDRAFT_267545 [Fragilariopsis cylindrus CCMP1102]|uniref:Uncharacterized protein n=1 Tax=Fragilariopsis cylindrus CCMP1102 TaxID=635003 RepID=A0A1E7FZ75_9STRA|nr:hypothetical protein FRACYDRAFT_267545 [Fragilariopsis cylindrus CCMP1102]|eukprot:OEU23462.1 hypothetical protein FRACYDRAFT_267545 [Fragilariopsis cylindrus CCMP1102]
MPPPRPLQPTTLALGESFQDARIPAFRTRTQATANSANIHGWELQLQGATSAASIGLQRLVAGDRTMMMDLVPHRSLDSVRTIRPTAMAIAQDHQDTVWEGEDAEANANTCLFQPEIELALGPHLQSLGINKLGSFLDFFKVNGAGALMDASPGSELADSNVSTIPQNFMLIPTMVNSEYITSSVNVKNESEFYKDRFGIKHYNTNFWNENIQHRHGGAIYGKLKYLVLGGIVEQMFLHQTQIAGHHAGYEELKRKNANVNTLAGSPCVKVKLYNIYVWIFNKIMTSAIVATARSHWFKPVLLFRSVLLRRNKIENQFELQTMDVENKSSIHLVGFYRKAANSNTVEYLALRGSNDKLASIAYNSR